jgi:bleomycin hydrolase
MGNMKSKVILFNFILLFFLVESCRAQSKPKVEKQLSKYEFTKIKELPHTPISYQDMSGTCWAFGTTSFIESEIQRKTGNLIDLSEMYVVRNAYVQKAYSHVMRHGQLPFFEGALNHDALESMDLNGIVPYTVYTGLKGKDKYHDHSKLSKKIKETLPKYLKKGIRNGDLIVEINEIINKHMEEVPSHFVYDNKQFTPKSLLEANRIDMKDYVHVTSFNHKPFYKDINLDVEWNFTNTPFYNLPLNDYYNLANTAIDSGYTIAIELDVSEEGYSGEYGIGVVPDNLAHSTKILYDPLPEKQSTQEYRQQEFENFNTNNDHNQHIVGKVKDQNGKTYFIAKNSWRDWGRDGYVYISESYFKLKVLYYTIHKDCLKMINSK